MLFQVGRWGMCMCMCVCVWEGGGWHCWRRLKCFAGCVGGGEGCGVGGGAGVSSGSRVSRGGGAGLGGRGVAGGTPSLITPMNALCPSRPPGASCSLTPCSLVPALSPPPSHPCLLTPVSSPLPPHPCLPTPAFSPLPPHPCLLTPASSPIQTPPVFAPPMPLHPLQSSPPTHHALQP